MVKESEPWRSASAQRCGTAMDPILCLSALVLTRDPSGKRPPKAIFSTDPTQTAEQIVRDAHEALESGGDF
jgi:hypothetical protein